MNKHLLLLVAVALCSHVLSQGMVHKLNTSDSIRITKIYEVANRYLDINTDSSRIFSRQGINLSDVLNYPKGIADGYFYIALSYDLDNKLDSGIRYYKKSLRVYKNVQALKSCAVTLSNIGELYLKKGNIDESFSSYNESLQFFDSINFNEGIARNYYNIGVIFKVNGNYQSAIDYFFKALSVSESIRDSIKIVLTYQEIGNMYSRQKNYGKAVNFYKKGLEILNHPRSKYQINIFAGLKTSLGKVYETDHNYENADSAYNEAYVLYKSINNQAGLATVLNNLGELNNKRCRYVQAMQYNTRSIELCKRLNSQYRLAYAIYNRGSIYRGMQLYQKSMGFFNEALEMAKSIKDKNLTKSIAEEMSLTYETMGNYRNAFVYYKLFKTIEDSLFNEENTRRITTIELQYQFDKKQKAQAFAQQKKELQFEAKIHKQKLTVRTIVISSSLLILLLFTGFGYYRNRQVAKLRALEIDLSRSIQQALSQQMNPHFIFNCLNSIKALILDSKIEETEKYFGVFAGLMRKNLEFSQYPAISINDEMETLKLYVQLEQLRFKNKFGFHTEIDSAIDQYTCKVPSLLFQPFVENAILHGFKNKEHGNIVVKMTLDEGEILCSVEDDGVGRQPTEQTSKKTHKSYGTTLARKRLEIIRKLYGNAKTMIIIDRKDQSGLSAGTRVEFGIPIIV